MHYIFEKLKNKSKPIIAVMTVILFYAVLQLFGITCPIKFLTGISCAGCGMTRAWLCLLRGDIAQAFYYHPLFLLPPTAVIILLLRNKISKKFLYCLLFIITAIFVIVYLYRMLFVHDSIVVFNPEDGFIFNTVSAVFNLLKSL